MRQPKILPHSLVETSVSEGILNAYVSLFFCLHIFTWRLYISTLTGLRKSEDFLWHEEWCHHINQSRNMMLVGLDLKLSFSLSCCPTNTKKKHDQHSLIVLREKATMNFLCRWVTISLPFLWVFLLNHRLKRKVRRQHVINMSTRLDDWVCGV